MEKLKHARLRVFVTAAVILLASAAVFIVSIQLAMGAEENKVIEQPSANHEAALAETPQPSPGLTTAPDETAVAGLNEKPHINNTVPSVNKEIAADVSTKPVESAAEQHVNNAAPQESAAQLITEDEAVESCIRVAYDVFGLTVDKSSLSALFNDKEDIKDDAGNIIDTTQEYWTVANSDFECYIDAALGGIISFNITSHDFPGKSIAETDFRVVGDITGPNGEAADMYNSPDNMYIKAAVQLVNERLANGRKIENISIDAVQFVWDDSESSSDPNATGTVQVDVPVIMEHGPNYRLSYWGTDEPVLKIFSSHPTLHACLWGYYYVDDAADYPPEGVSYEEWQEAKGIINGTYSTPPPATAPSK